MSAIQLPPVSAVAARLRSIDRIMDEECDVRLCVWESDDWSVQYGPVEYDPEHAPFCAAGSVPGLAGRAVPGGACNFEALATDLINEIADQIAEQEA